jgi:hypothetical protein
MYHYCRLASPPDSVNTNLQLFSLKQAAKYWNECIDLAGDGEIHNVEQGTERIVFILSCLGLSLSQLLGQNCPSPEKVKIDQPDKLLAALLVGTSIPKTSKTRLNHAFKEFLSHYDAVRHFGRNGDERHYRMLDQLTLKKLDQFRRTALEIWDVIITMPGNEIELKSISEVVKFNELAEHTP